MSTNLNKLLEQTKGADTAARLFRMLQIPAGTLQPLASPASAASTVTRLELAQALNMLLFDKLLSEVPEGAAYVGDAVRDGRKICFDHGALRTVLGPHTGALPSGEAALTRVLAPLGYHFVGLYPLDRINMTGRVYAHQDDAEGIAQFFVSELHPERFSAGFQDIVARVLSTSVDPLDARSKAALDALTRHKQLPFDQAAALLPVMLGCFERQHTLPTLAEYESLLQESSEMAWIATEGNVFNHATDRVDDVERLAQLQRDLGRPMKDKVEVSRNGRVRQTAFRATTVMREMADEHGQLVARKVPGSFYEFISRDHYVDETSQREQLDLTFDSGNAQGIFKMTAGASAC